MTPLGDVATIAVRGPGESYGEMALALVGLDARYASTSITSVSGTTPS
jgi:hypothetical protein